jgi:hypothetical protein
MARSIIACGALIKLKPARPTPDGEAIDEPPSIVLLG